MPTKDFRTAFDEAFARLDVKDHNGRPHNFVLIHDLRMALPQYRRNEFDLELNKLRKQNLYTLDVADGRHKRLTREETAGGLKEGGTVLAYAAKVVPYVDDELIENPSGDSLNLGHFYSDGIDDSATIELEYFDLPKMAKQVIAGADRFAVVRAALDVYFKEAEEGDFKKDFLEQNEDVLEEAAEEGIDAEAVYTAWKRGWRDGATTYLAGEPLQEEIQRLLDANNET